MKVTVRRATREDAAKIAEFAVALAEQHVGYDPVRFSNMMTPEGASWFYGGRTGAENAAVLVAESDDRVVGFAYMQFEPVLYAELATNVAWLHDIYVEPESQHTGAGRELIKGSLDVAKKFGASKVLLSVAATNTGAQKFFQQAGFATTMHEMMLIPGGESE